MSPAGSQGIQSDIPQLEGFCTPEIEMCVRFLDSIQESHLESWEVIVGAFKDKIMDSKAQGDSQGEKDEEPHHWVLII